jgi:hypothetical protein
MAESSADRPARRTLRVIQEPGPGPEWCRTPKPGQWPLSRPSSLPRISFLSGIFAGCVQAARQGGGQVIGDMPVTVVVRWLPGLSVRCGTRMAQLVTRGVRVRPSSASQEPVGRSFPDASHSAAATSSTSSIGIVVKSMSAQRATPSGVSRWSAGTVIFVGRPFPSSGLGRISSLSPNPRSENSRLTLAAFQEVRLVVCSALGGRAISLFRSTSVSNCIWV